MSDPTLALSPSCPPTFSASPSTSRLSLSLIVALVLTDRRGRTPGDASAALCHEEVSEMSKRTTGTIIACLIDMFKEGTMPKGRQLPRTPELMPEKAHTKRQKKSE